MTNESNDANKYIPPHDAVNPVGDGTAFSSCQPCGKTRSGFDRDISSRIAKANDKYASSLQLGGSAIGVGVNLKNPGIEVFGIWRDSRYLIIRHRHNDVLCFVAQ